jgi:hypothetical protein
MDYSLLLAIEENPEPEFKFSLNNRTNLTYNDSRNKIGNYHIGIIDFLQQFNF